MKKNFIKRIQKGDPKAIDDIYMLYEKVVMGFIHKKNPSLDEEEKRDVFHDTLISFKNNVLSGRLKELKSAKLETYLCQIAYNRGVTTYQKKRTKIEREMIVDKIPNHIKPSLHPLLRKERKEQLAQIFKDIGEECRKVLLLFYFKGYGSQAVGDTLDISSESARKKKERCVKGIYKKYHNELS